jgi:MFS family permease
MIQLLAGMVYFIQGALGLTAIATPLYLASLGLTIPQIALLGLISGFPWYFKILMGLLSDYFPIFKSRRKAYLILSCIISFACYILLALPVPYSFAILCFIFSGINLGFAFTDVVTDALVVENSGKNPERLQNICWGMRSLGAVITGFLGGYLLQWLSYQQLFGLVALLPLISLIPAFLVKETGLASKFDVTVILSIFRRKDVLIFLTYILIGSISPSFGLPFFFHMKDTLGFSTTLLGTLGSIGSLCFLIGAFLYGFLIKTIKINLKQMLIIGLFISVISQLSYFFIISPITAIVQTIIFGILGYIAFIPFMNYSAKLSNITRNEGFIFATFMGCSNLSGAINGYLGGVLYPIIGLNPLIWISSLSTFIILVPLIWLKDL